LLALTGEITDAGPGLHCSNISMNSMAGSVVIHPVKDSHQDKFKSGQHNHIPAINRSFPHAVLALLRQLSDQQVYRLPILLLFNRYTPDATTWCLPIPGVHSWLSTQNVEQHVRDTTLSTGEELPKGKWRTNSILTTAVTGSHHQSG
jgi:hypothetical protein